MMTSLIAFEIVSSMMSNSVLVNASLQLVLALKCNAKRLGL